MSKETPDLPNKKSLGQQFKDLSQQELIDHLVELKLEVERLWQAVQENQHLLTEALRTDEVWKTELSTQESNERFAELDDEQLAVFKRIDEIGGHGAVTLRAVERELHSLVGKPVTKSFVNALKIRLRERHWRIVCTCGCLSTPIWQRHPNCKRGGFLALYHRDSAGKDTRHANTTTVPKFRFADPLRFSALKGP